jgi:DNA-directed RNA polymerase subunit RPC12/RpoP
MSELKMEAHCPECGSPIPPPASDDPNTPIKCASCGADLGTVGEALEAAKKKLLGEVFGDDEA